MTGQFLWFEVQRTATAAIGIHPTTTDCHSWWISKMQSDTLEERYAIKFCYKRESFFSYFLILARIAMLKEWGESLKWRQPSKRKKTVHRKTPGKARFGTVRSSGSLRSDRIDGSTKGESLTPEEVFLFYRVFLKIIAVVSAILFCGTTGFFLFSTSVLTWFLCLLYSFISAVSRLLDCQTEFTNLLI